MIRQQCPGMHGHGTVIRQLPEPGDKIISIGCVQEDLPFFNIPAHDMMEHAGSLPEADRRPIKLTVA